MSEAESMVPYHPKQILVQKQCWQDPLTREILERLPGVQPVTIADTDKGLADSACGPHSGSFGRHTLILIRYPGAFMKNCQGSGAEICCNYFIVSYTWNCHMECTYCILQSYLNNEALIVCTNIDSLLAEVKGVLERSPKRIFRIGTGELADSLALDHITCFSRRLVPFFASVPNAFLELKTKSDQIANLKDLDHGGHTIVSWSLNSKRICRTEELKASSLEERLAAALQCQEWGYRLGFHFDPIVYYEGWESEYREAVKEVFRAVDPNKVVWVSLGALRFTPNLRGIIRKRFPKSIVTRGEFIPGHHGKLRYFRPIREEMYRKMRSWIQEEAPQVFVYLCMESGVVWERSFGSRPCDACHLSDQMDARASICSPLPWGGRV